MSNDRNPPQQDTAATTTPPAATAPPAASAPGLPELGLRTRLFDGTLDGRITPGPGNIEGRADYLGDNGNRFGASALLGTQPMSLERVGLNGMLGLPGQGQAGFSFDAEPPGGRFRLGTDWKFGNGNLFNANFDNTPNGDILKAGTTLQLGRGDTLTAAFENNGIERFRDYRLNADFQDRGNLGLNLNQTQAGSIFNGNGTLNLAPNTTFNGSANINGVDNTSLFKLDGSLPNNNRFDLSLNNTPNGSIFNGSGTYNPSAGTTFNGSANINGVDNTSLFKIDGSLPNNNRFDLSLNNTPNGSIFNGSGTYNPSAGTTLNGSANINGVDNTSLFKLDGSLPNNNRFDLSLNNTPNGSIFNGSGTYNPSAGTTLNGSANVNGVDNTSLFKLDGSLPNNNRFDLSLNNTPNGSIFNGSGTYNPSAGTTLNGSANVNGVDNTSLFKIDGSLPNNNRFDLSLNNTPNGSIFNGSGTYNPSAGTTLNGSANINGVDNTSLFKLDGSLPNNNRFDLSLNNTPNGSIFNGSGTYNPSAGTTFNGSANINGVDNTSLFKIDGSLPNNNRFDLSLNNTPNGSIFNGSGTYNPSAGTTFNGSANVNGVDNTSLFKLDGSLPNNNRFDLSLNNTPNGSIFNGNTTLTLSPGNTFAGSVLLDGVNRNNEFKLSTDLREGRDRFALDLRDTPNGDVLKLDGKYTLSPGNLLSGSAEFNGIEKFKDFRFSADLNQGRDQVNLNLRDTPNGDIFKVDGKLRLGEGTLTGGAELNGVDRFQQFRLGGEFDRGDRFGLNLRTSPDGTVFNGDGKLMLNRTDALTATASVDGIQRTSDFRLGGEFGKDRFNLGIGTTPQGTSFGVGAQFGFDDGRGQAGLDARFGPQRNELTGSVVYKAKDLEYSGNVRFNDERGRFDLSELNAKLTKGDDRVRFGVEAGWKPQNNEWSVGVGLTINFGGGGSSRSSRGDDAPSMPRFDPGLASQRLDGEISQFRDKQAVALLNPHDKRLYDQAAAGVEKLNAQGAGLPVRETAASLAALANQNGLHDIQQVSLGNRTSDGRQNLFISNGDPGDPAAKSAAIDRNTAAATPVQTSTARLNNTPDAPAAQPEQGQTQAAPGGRR